MEILILLIIIVAAVVARSYFKKQKAINAAFERYNNWLEGLLKSCKSEDQKLAVRFLVSNLEEDYYLKTCDSKIRESVRQKMLALPHPTEQQFRQMLKNATTATCGLDAALKKANLDIDEVTEIEPIQLEGFKVGKTTYKDVFGTPTNYARVSGDTLYTDTYECTWLMLTNDQVIMYIASVNIITGKSTARTEEFFYRDVTSMSTLEETETYKKFGAEETTEISMFRMSVSGDKFQLAANVSDNFESKVKALKSKLREKKTA